MSINLLLNDYYKFLMRTVRVYGIDTYNYCKETDPSQLILNYGTQSFGICFISLSDIKLYTYYLLTRFTPHEVSSSD